MFGVVDENIESIRAALESAGLTVLSSGDIMPPSNNIDSVGFCYAYVGPLCILAAL